MHDLFGIIISKRISAYAGAGVFARTVLVTSYCKEIASRAVSLTPCLRTTRSGSRLPWFKSRHSNSPVPVVICPDQSDGDRLLCKASEESGKRKAERKRKAGQVRYWQYGQVEKSPDLVISDLSRFLRLVISDLSRFLRHFLRSDAHSAACLSLIPSLCWL